ncbi:MAG: hypothetical protein HOP04_02000 [Methylophilaceae bacterium]|nr:hypothetical protein [Methylophilaceae bacterium]
MSTIPTLEAIQTLDGRNFAMLTAEEQAVLTFYRDQGRKFDVVVAPSPDSGSKDHMG